MLTCLAMALSIVSAPQIPALAAQVETQARALSAQTEINPAFLTSLDEFSANAEQLSASLRAAGVTQDLPCIFHGISEDAHARVADFQSAASEGARHDAFEGLRALLDDAVLIAPMAAEAAAAAPTQTPAPATDGLR